jgi:fused signal recognition particle receptor
MFGFLKDKLKGALKVFSKKVDEEGDIEEVEKTPELIPREEPKKKPELQKAVPTHEKKDDKEKERIAQEREERANEDKKRKEAQQKQQEALQEEERRKEETAHHRKEIETHRQEEEHKAKELHEAHERRSQERKEEEQRALHREAEQRLKEQQHATRATQERLEKEEARIKARKEEERRQLEAEQEQKIREEKEREELSRAEEHEQENLRQQESVREQLTTTTVEEHTEKEKRGIFSKIFGKKKKEEAPLEETVPEEKPQPEKKTAEQPTTKPQPEKKEREPEREEEQPEEKRGIFKRIQETFTTITISEKKFDEIFWDLEVVLLENNVAVEVIDKIKNDLKTELTTKKIPRGSLEDVILKTLKTSIKELFKGEGIDLINEAHKKKPYIIAFIGVNGSGKTTTLAKIAHLLLENKLSVCIAAADTFRAAAIQQLEEHADRLGVKLIKQDYKSDPAAVAFDAISHAKAKGIDVVLIDTAGRLHSNDNLMNELKKLIRVNTPDLKIFVGESITGNDCIEQARLFDEAVGIDGIILAKADVDEKGGAAVSVSYVTGKPIMYLGMGQKYEDLKKFKPEIILENLGL